MGKISLFPKTHQRIVLLGLIVLIIAFSLFNSGLRLNDRIGLGLLVVAVLIAVSGAVHWLAMSSKDKNGNNRSPLQLFSFFKTSAMIGVLTSVLVYVGAITSAFLGGSSVSGPYLGILVAIWFYAGLVLGALSLIALAITSLLIKKDRTKHKSD